MNGLSRVIILTDRSLDLLFEIVGYIVQHLFGDLNVKNDMKILFHRTLWMVVPNYISIDMCKVTINFYKPVL